MKLKRLYEYEEKYINNSRHRDYGTGNVIDADIFDTRSTGVSFYDALINNADYMAKAKNLKGDIVYMTPYQYFQECSDNIFTKHPSIDSLIKQRSYDKEGLDDLYDIVVNHKRQLHMPFLNYAENGQEGLHRMLLASRLFGWNEKKFPVLVVNWYDEQQHQEEVKWVWHHKYEYAVEDVIYEAKRYSYPENKFEEYFTEQIKWEIEKSHEFPDGVDKNELVDNVKVSVYNDDVTVQIGDFDFDYNLSDFRLDEPEDDEDSFEDDIDDMSSDEILATINNRFLR